MKILPILILSIGVFCSSAAQVGKLDYQFNTDGDAQGWTSLNNSTSEVAAGVMKVTFDPAQFSTSSRRADITHTGGATVDPTSYPIIAIKYNKPAVVRLTFDTSKGSYKNGYNKYDGVLNGNVYYYNIATGTFGSTATLLTAETALTTFQFKIADITSAETDYSVDWIASFASLAELQNTLSTNDFNIQKNELNVYPNPSTDKFFNIDLDSLNATDVVEVKVYGLLGNLVLEQTLEANANRVNHDLGAGIYVVKVGNSSVKLIVQ